MKAWFKTQIQMIYLDLSRDYCQMAFNYNLKVKKENVFPSLKPGLPGRSGRAIQQSKTKKIA